MARAPITIAAVVVGAACCAAVVAAAAATSATPSEPPAWRLAGGDGLARLERQQWLAGEGHTGGSCLWLEVRGENGAVVSISHEVARPRVIDEATPTVWLKSDRAGAQLTARVVLPRTLDPRTGQPLLVDLPGSNYTDIGRWQQLRVDDLPRALVRQVWVLRSQLRAAIDEREAFIESVTLRIYTAAGATHLWIDDLQVAGFAATPSNGPQPPMQNVALTNVNQRGPALSPGNPAPPPQRVVFDGTQLKVDDRPFFPRIIQHQGEPLAVLKQLGFNTVWVEQPPPPQLLDEAARLRLWVVCPPPQPGADVQSPSATAAALEIGPQYGCVLAWNLGLGLTRQDNKATERLAQQVRAADRAGGRPLVCRAAEDLRGLSRHVDLLLLDRRPLGTSLELTDYAAWLRQQPRLARPGTPFWTTVQTQLAPALLAQLRAFEPQAVPPASVADTQLRLLLYTAVAAGSRGLLVLSNAPLTADDADTRGRAMSLELLNLELELMELWGAAGSVVANAEATEPQVTTAVLRSSKSQLLMPTWLSPAAQYVPAQSAAATLALTAPGVPESCNAYALTPGGIDTLRHKRVTGGMQVTLGEFGLTGLVLLAQEPLVINGLTQRATAIGQRAAELRRAIAARQLTTVGEVARQVGVRTKSPQQIEHWLGAARQNLASCDQQLAAHEYSAAYAGADRAMRPLRMIERSYWEKAVEGLPSPLTSPATVSFQTLPSHWRLTARVVASRLGPNRLQGGEFEDLPATMQAGWRHFQHPSPGVETSADVTPQARHSGRSGLTLSVRPTNPAAPPAIIESPPLWITTPPVPVEAGQVVCIRGWAWLPAPLTGSVDGLLIVDSLGGEDLALRLGKTNGWQEFVLYRAAATSEPVSVTFVVTGLGEVRLDDVGVYALQ